MSPSPFNHYGTDTNEQEVLSLCSLPYFDCLILPNSYSGSIKFRSCFFFWCEQLVGVDQKVHWSSTNYQPKAEPTLQRKNIAQSRLIEQKKEKFNHSHGLAKKKKFTAMGVSRILQTNNTNYLFEI